MSAGLHHRTPTLQALDNSGLAVRRIDYHRTAATDTATARVTWYNHDAAGRLVAQWDPRLFARLHAGEPTRANLSTLYSLSGLPVATDSVDAGWRLSLLAETGLPRQQWDSRQTQRQIDYDPQLRPLTITESVAGAVLGTSPRVAERFTYGAATPEAARRNQCGRLIRHDDSAGSRTLNDYSFRGLPLSETRHFLKTLDEPHWPESIAERDMLLESGTGATTQWQYGATDDVLAQTDTCGHRQRFDYSVSGDQVQVRLRLANGAEQIIVRDVQYDAFGEIQRQTAGNGLISTAEYDPADGRLRRLSTSSPNRAALQDLHYDYDPAGNVVRIEDQAQTTRHFANQRIEPVNTYGYDTLYQLIEATGREVKTGASHGPALPDLQNLPPDPNQITNYTQTYDYDAAGNLLDMHHVGGQSFTRTMLVAPDSNRSLPRDETDVDFDTGFDANGNLQQLVRGQSLRWDLRNQLREVTAVKRDDRPDDNELYIYDGGGQRCRKVRSTQTGSRTLIGEVRYLPGLEIRSKPDGETLHVISVQAGLNSVRALHWSSTPPSGIANDQLRYSFSDHVGSSTLELDQQGDLISQESYYPFGGSAWWGARSAVEAKYKTVRYSGRERDASGLYYYGLRYYAPWLLRWINPDPAGDVDGLNLYQMVGNNPINYSDTNGTSKRYLVDNIIAHEELLELTKNRVEAARRQIENHSSTEKTLSSLAKRGGAEVIKAVAKAGGAAAGGAVGGIAAGVVSAGGAAPVGVAAGAYLGGKLAGTVAGAITDELHLTDSINLKASKLKPSSIKEEAGASATSLFEMMKLQLKKSDPRTDKGFRKATKSASKTVLAKVPVAGAVLKYAPTVVEAGYELKRSGREIAPEKLDTAIQNLEGLGSLLKKEISRFPEMYANAGVTQISYVPAFWKKTYEQLETSTNEVMDLISSTLNVAYSTRDQALKNSRNEARRSREGN